MNKYYCTGEVLENGYLKCVLPEMEEPEKRHGIRAGIVFNKRLHKWKTYLASLPLAALVVGGKTGWLDGYVERYQCLWSYGQGSRWSDCSKEVYDLEKDDPKRILLVKKLTVSDEIINNLEFIRDNMDNYILALKSAAHDDFYEIQLSVESRKFYQLMKQGIQSIQIFPAPVVEDRPKWVELKELKRIIENMEGKHFREEVILDEVKIQIHKFLTCKTVD